jgi:hypothetical protein
MPGPIRAYTNRGQGVLLVLFALQDLGGTNTKQEVIARITHARWYEVTRHDLPPYEGQNEPKYHTLLAWARKDCYERDWMLRTDVRDDWAISRDGRGVLEKAIMRFRSKGLDARKCYLWTPAFKREIDPSYHPSDADAVRPEDERERLMELLKDL